MTQHTPGPFHWEIESQDHRTLTLMAGAPYRTLAYVRFPTYNPTRPNEITSKDKANARFIVQACNSHDELLEALRPLAALGLWEDNYPPDSDEYAEARASDSWLEVWVRPSQVRAARAAIAKAGG